MSDALPILERAKSVLVVTIKPETTPVGHGEVPGADVALHLACHKAEVQDGPGR